MARSTPSRFTHALTVTAPASVVGRDIDAAVTLASVECSLGVRTTEYSAPIQSGAAVRIGVGFKNPALLLGLRRGDWHTADTVVPAVLGVAKVPSTAADCMVQFHAACRHRGPHSSETFGKFPSLNAVAW